MENITQYFVPERDPWYNKGIAIGEERGEERKKREFTARLLLKSDYSVEVIAILTDASVDYVNTVKTELTQIRILLESKNSITKTAKTVGVTFDYVKKIKEALDNP